MTLNQERLKISIQFQVCYFFSDCSSLDESCTTCISGEKTCDISPGGEGKEDIYI